MNVRGASVIAVFIAAPVELSEVLRAKNLVHGVAGFTLALIVSVFYVVYFGTGSFFAYRRRRRVGGRTALRHRAARGGR